MSEPWTLIELDQDRVAPFGAVSGRVRALDVDPAAIRAGEILVLWYTEGKGDMDSQVVHGEPMDVRAGVEQTFRVQLPGLPISYLGHLLKIHWVVRVRLDMHRGRDIVTDKEFEMAASLDSGSD